jgi:hypothetical protein
VLILGTELWPTVGAFVPGLFYLPYIYIGKLVPLHPCVPRFPTMASQGLRTQARHVAPPWWGAPIVDHHDCILHGERRHVTYAWVFIEFHSPSEGPRDHEILYHVAFLKLVLDRVRVVRACLLEESLKVVCRQPHLVLATVSGSRDVPPRWSHLLSCCCHYHSRPQP